MIGLPNLHAVEAAVQIPRLQDLAIFLKFFGTSPTRSKFIPEMFPCFPETRGKCRDFINPDYSYWSSSVRIFFWNLFRSAYLGLYVALSTSNLFYHRGAVTKYGCNARVPEGLVTGQYSLSHFLTPTQECAIPLQRRHLSFDVADVAVGIVVVRYYGC